MRKLFFGVGILSTILVIAILVGVGYAVFVGSGQDEEAKQYADNSVIVITSHWNVNELTSRVS